ncbi:hypothetical protein JCM8202v2_003569 [Rhodotorula sphaerocarpa]
MPPVPSISSSSSGSTNPTSRPAAPLSCETCRLRKIRCSRSPDAAACDACTRKDIQCIFTERPKTRNRSGKNVEAARLRYGATGSSTPSSGSNSPPTLAAQDSLAQQELAASFGSRLFEEWIDVGRQQTNRLIGRSRQDITKGLEVEAEGLADRLALWRKPDLLHVAPLLLLYKVRETENAHAEDAEPYLAAAAAQFRQLARREPGNLNANAGGPITNLCWSLVIMDAFGAAERRHMPHLWVSEVATYLGREHAAFPTFSELQASLEAGPEAAMSRVLDGVHVGVLLAHDLATYASGTSCTRGDLESIWARMDEVYEWCRTAGFACSVSPADGSWILRIYTSLLWAVVITMEFTVSELISDAISRAVSAAGAAHQLPDTAQLSGLVALCSTSQRRILVAICQYLPQNYPRDSPPFYALGIMHGVICSVARVLDIARALVSAPANDPALFPLGVADKLAAVEFLLVQIARLEIGYPGTRMSETVDMLTKERDKLRQLALEPPDSVSAQVAHFVPADLHAPSTALLQAPYPPSSSFAMPQAAVVDEPVLDDFFAPSLLGSDSPFLLPARNDFGADWNFL